MSAAPHLSAGACVLRPFREEDEEALARHANDQGVSRNLRDRLMREIKRLELAVAELARKQGD